jgi:hypothetical protein
MLSTSGFHSGRRFVTALVPSFMMTVIMPGDNDARAGANGKSNDQDDDEE